MNNLCKKNSLNNIENGILDFKYRLRLEIKSVYGLYKLEKPQDITEFICDNTTKETLTKYIKLCYENSNNLYQSLDKTKEYSIYGCGIYAMYFLSFYKDLHP